MLLKRIFCVLPRTYIETWGKPLSGTPCRFFPPTDRSDKGHFHKKAGGASVVGSVGRLDNLANIQG